MSFYEFFVPKKEKVIVLLIIIIVNIFIFWFFANSALCDPTPCPPFYSWDAALIITAITFIVSILLIYLPICYFIYRYSKKLK